MPTNGAEERSGREIGLLMLVIVVAVAVLLVLARFRFPAVDLAAVPPTPGPLERLAARATFDDLASTLADVTTRVRPAFAVVAIERMSDRPARRGAPSVPVESDFLRWVPALRVRPDLLLAYVPAGMRITAVEGLSASPQMAASDAARELTLVRVLPGAGPTADFGAGVADFAGAAYVVAIEGALGGPSTRPAFVARADSVADSRWGAPLLVVGGEPQVSAGAFLFTLDGRFIGLTVRQHAGVAIVPAATLDRAVAELATGAGGGQR